MGIQLLLVFLLLGLMLGYLTSEYKQHIKNSKRRERHKEIINAKKYLNEELWKWGHEHKKNDMIDCARGITIFKGGTDRMTDSEFRRNIGAVKCQMEQ